MKHARQIERLAAEYGLGLADSFNASIHYCLANKKGINTLLSQVNHPNRKGHEIVAQEIIDWFPMGL
jgi:lysophospholipase L1-like esterase